MAREHVSFAGAGGVRLVGRLESPPAGEPAAYALFAHCFTCSKDLRAYGVISRQLVARGIAVLRFDFTGVGESGGELAETTFGANVEDVLAAADFLRRERRAPALLVGHSLGGAAVLAAAPSIPEAVAVATLATPADTGHLRQKLADAAAGAAAAGRAGGDLLEIDLGAGPVRVRRRLLDDLGRDHLRGALAKLGKALLVLHSPADRVFGIEHGERLFREARQPKSFLCLDGADHLLSDPADAARAGALLAEWAVGYLAIAPAGTGLLEAAAPPPGAVPAPARPLAPGEVEVRGLAGSLRQEIRAGAHVLHADEPLADGGTDTGPTPYGLLLAALGACTSMTLHLYARRKGIPLEEARVRLRHSRSYADDCADCPQGTPRVERIDRELELGGPLSDEQRARLLEIANRCPVHRTLETPVTIVTRLV